MTITTDAALVYDDYNTTGVIASGIKKPTKAAIRALFASIDSDIDTRVNLVSVRAYSTRALAIAATIPAATTGVWLHGYTSLGDAPPAFYYRAGGNPGHPGFFQDASGAYFVIRPAAGNFLDIRWFGAKCDVVTDDLAAYTAAYDCAVALGYATVIVPAPGMVLGSVGTPISGARLRGVKFWAPAGPARTLLHMPGNSAICVWMDGAAGVAGGGFEGFTFWAPASRTTGQALRMDGDIDYQPDEVFQRDNRITGVGAWDIPLYVSGRNRTPTRAVKIAGGTGYLVNDVLTISGGAFSVAAQVTVLAVSLGAITAALVTRAGTYTVYPGASTTVTMTIATPGVVTWTAHGLAVDSPVVFSTTGALPTGYTAGVTYYVRSPAANTFQVSATPGGASIATSGTQSGVHSAVGTVVTTTGGTGTGATFTVTPNSLVGIRATKFENWFIGASTSIGAYFDSFAELHLDKFGIYQTGAGGALQLTNSLQDYKSSNLSCSGLSVGGQLYVGRVQSGVVAGFSTSLYLDTGSQRIVCSGTSGGVTPLGTANKVDQVV